MRDHIVPHLPKRLPALAPGWRYADLGSLIDPSRPITYGVVQPGPHVPDGVPLIRGGDYSDSWKPLAELRRVAPAIDEQFARARLTTGDLVITIKGDVGTCAQVPSWLNGANLSQTNARLSIDAVKANPRYVLHYLQSRMGRREVYEHTKTGAQPGLIFDDIRKFQVPLPPAVTIQDDIASLLDSWDEGINTCERLLDRKSRVLDARSLQVLIGRAGLRTRSWRPVTLTDVTTELATRNSGRLGAKTVMGVNKTLGMIPMRDHVRAGDLSRYKIVGPDAFAYNPMRLNIGSIARNHHGREVLVSPDYVAFATHPDVLHPGYFDHLRRTSLWSTFVKNAGSGGVRVRIYYDDLSDFVFDLPPLDEQVAITEFLDAARREVSLIEQRRDALDRQKRGLMQKLLTGEWRVNGAEAAA